jgi:hypothetical protein
LKFERRLHSVLLPGRDIRTVRLQLHLFTICKGNDYSTSHRVHGTDCKVLHAHVAKVAVGVKEEGATLAVLTDEVRLP